jgi:cyclic beta-1,2-glucan synthetase
MHRAAIESIFGLRQGAQDLCFTPCLPSHWHQAELTLVRDGRTMRFILVHATAPAALAATAQYGARLLLPRQPLYWRGLAPDTCFAIPLLGESAPVPSAAGDAEAAGRPWPEVVAEG